MFAEIETASHRLTFEAIGVPWEIVSPVGIDSDSVARVHDAIEQFDREWSRFRPDSLVSTLARDGGAVPVSVAGIEMLEEYRAVSDLTSGRVHPLVGSAMERLGYDRSYSFDGSAYRQRGPLPQPHAWSNLVSWDSDTLRITSPALIDVGALGKGRLVDLVAAEFDHPVTVDASGDMMAKGRRERVALEHPYDARRAVGVVEIENEALCASASNRRVWGDGLHHVIDATTGQPVTTIVATWAIASTTMIADAAATTLFFDDGPRYAAHRSVDWVRMHSSGKLEWNLGQRLENAHTELFV